MKIPIKTVEECPYRKWDFDDPNDDFSMDWMCKFPDGYCIYCDKKEIPSNCPLKRIEKTDVNKKMIAKRNIKIGEIITWEDVE